MEFFLQQDASELAAVSSVILPLADVDQNDDALVSESLHTADTLLNGAISHAIKIGDLSSKFESSQLFLNPGAGPDRVLVIGTGIPEKLSGRKYKKLVQTAWSKISTNPGSSVLNLLTTADTTLLDQASKVRLTVEAVGPSPLSL